MEAEVIRYLKLVLIGFVFAYIYLFLNQYQFFRKNLIGQILPFASGIGGAILIVYSNVLLLDFIGGSNVSLVEYIGVFLIIIAAVLFILSWELNFKMKGHTEDEKYLYTKGMYALSRNPQTFAIFIILLGEILYTLNLQFISYSVLNMVLFFIYIKLEEKLDLEKKFGEKLNEYKEETPLLLPTPSSIKKCINTFWGRG